MQAEGVEWGEDYRGARQALVGLLEGRMRQPIDQHLERMADLGGSELRARDCVASPGRVAAPLGYSV